MNTEHIALLRERIALVLASTEPKTRTRNRALAQIKWVLVAPDGSWVTLDGLQASLTTKREDALVFDGRDNEDLKRQHYRVALGVELAVVLL